MSDLLAGRTAVVTGASAGIGRVLVGALAGRGMRVVAAARDADKLRALAEEVGPAVLPVATDIADEASIARLVTRAQETCGAIDVVVNNAAIGYLEPFLDSDQRRWRETVETNLFGALMVARAFLPAMLAAGRGAVINVGSSGATGWPYLALYAASKAALQAASISIDREITGRGVRVLSVEIGSTSGTDFGSRFDRRHVQAATSAWTASGIKWNTEVKTPAQSAQAIVAVIEQALGGAA